jgi:hypothetical protein
MRNDPRSRLEGAALNGLSDRTWKSLYLFAGWFAAIFTFYSLFGLPNLFMREESGILQRLSLLPIQEGWAGMRIFVYSAYSGHFAPVAFTAEFFLSRLVGPIEAFWFVRQCLAMSVFATVATMAMREINPANSLLGSAALAAILVFHPFSADLVSWPIMILQIACLTCMFAAAMFVARFARDPSPRTAWLCAMSGYASMHFLGVGLAVSLATLCALLLTSWARSSVRVAKWPLLVGTLLTALHAVPIMLKGGGPEGPVQWIDSIKRFLILFVEQPIAALRTTFATPWAMHPDLSIPLTQIVWGAVFAIIAAACLIAGWRRGFSGKLGALPVVTLALGAYALTCALVAARLRADTGAAVLVPFLIGGRYLVFPIFFAVLAAGVLRVPAYVYVAGAIGMMISTAVFIRGVAPSLWPFMFV